MADGVWICAAQFNDPRLRQFNLVAIDRLGHGDSRGVVTEDTVPEKTAVDFKQVLVRPSIHSHSNSC